MLFKNENLEKLFIEELKPFILAGRLQHWALPADILENQILGHIKNSESPDIVEKIIINLCLKESTADILKNLIEYCEENCLSSSLIYLHT